MRGIFDFDLEAFGVKKMARRGIEEINLVAGRRGFEACYEMSKLYTGIRGEESDFYQIIPHPFVFAKSLLVTFTVLHP